MLTFIKTGRPYSRPTWSGQNCPRRWKSTITIMANTLTITTHQVANLGIILTEVESVSVSLIVSNPGPYSSVVLDAEVKVTDQIIIESYCKRWTILSLKDCKLHDRGFLVAWTPLRATTQEDRLFACFGWFLFICCFFFCLFEHLFLPRLRRTGCGKTTFSFQIFPGCLWEALCWEGQKRTSADDGHCGKVFQLTVCLCWNRGCEVLWRPHRFFLLIIINTILLLSWISSLW